MKIEKFFEKNVKNFSKLREKKKNCQKIEEKKNASQKNKKIFLRNSIVKKIHAKLRARKKYLGIIKNFTLFFMYVKFRKKKMTEN